MKKIQHQFDENYTPEKGSINTLPSETVPDQSLSIREILQNSINGLDHTIMQEGQYFDSPIPKTLDLLDLPQRRKTLDEDQIDLNDQITYERQQKQALLPSEEKNLLKQPITINTEGDSLT